MTRYPDIVTVRSVINGAKIVSTKLPDGRWVPCRGLGWQSWHIRWQAAWLVFTGRADALLWDGQ
jgi:hypothetical protein